MGLYLTHIGVGQDEPVLVHEKAETLIADLGFFQLRPEPAKGIAHKNGMAACGGFEGIIEAQSWIGARPGYLPNAFLGLKECLKKRKGPMGCEFWESR